MIYFFYFSSLALSVYGIGFSGSSMGIWFWSGGFLFLAFLVEIVDFLRNKELSFRRKNRVGRGVVAQPNVDYRDSLHIKKAIHKMPQDEYIEENDPVYSKSYIDFLKNSKKSYENNIAQKEDIKKEITLDKSVTLLDDDFNMKCKIKGDVYEAQIHNLIREACKVFGTIHSYRLLLETLEINPRGLRDKFDEKIDISFKIRDSFGKERVGAIQCKNWDSAYEVKTEYVYSFLGKAFALEDVFVHAFFVCNLATTTCGIDRNSFKNVNFLTVPSKKRANLNKSGAVDDLLNQTFALEKNSQKDFGVEFSLAMLYAARFEINK